MVAIVAIIVVRRRRADSSRQGRIRFPTVFGGADPEVEVDGATAFHNPLFFNVPGDSPYAQTQEDTEGLYEEPSVSTDMDV